MSPAFRGRTVCGAHVSFPGKTLPASVINQAPQAVDEMFSPSAMPDLFVNILSGRQDIENVSGQLQTKANENENGRRCPTEARKERHSNE